MDSALIVAALLLSSVSLVWGLICLWQRNIERGPPPQEPPPPERTDPMHLALRGSGIDLPGSQALQHAPPWPSEVTVDWSASIQGPANLELAVADDRAAVGWLVVGGAEVWAAEPETRTALAELHRFGSGLELNTVGNLAWLFRQGAGAADPFDLLCQLAAAAWLAGPRQEWELNLKPDTIYPVAWQEEGWEYGGLPPFGRLEVRDSTVRLRALSRLPVARGRHGVPEFGAHEVELSHVNYTACLDEDDAVQWQAEGRVVTARHLSGNMADSLSERGLLPAAIEDGEA